MSKSMDEIVRDLGFKDENEMLQIVANVDLSTPDKLEAFKQWKENDGSKEGLCKLMNNA